MYSWLTFYLNLFENEYSYKSLTTSHIEKLYMILADYAYGGVTRILSSKYFVPMIMPIVCEELANHISDNLELSPMVVKLNSLKARFKDMRVYS